MVKRFEVYLVNLDLLPSKDAKNTRPIVIISPDELNRNLETVIIAPIASTNAQYPTRIAIDFLNSKRFVILDQIRTVDKVRLVKKIGEIDAAAQRKTIDKLHELFAE
ncbi:MAG: type II toxin-antitoxin system PemK/MazF family toxin [Pyrinomonadaceae bacterium]